MYLWPKEEAKYKSLNKSSIECTQVPPECKKLLEEHMIPELSDLVIGYLDDGFIIFYKKTINGISVKNINCKYKRRIGCGFYNEFAGDFCISNEKQLNMMLVGKGNRFISHLCFQENIQKKMLFPYIPFFNNFMLEKYGINNYINNQNIDKISLNNHCYVINNEQFLIELIHIIKMLCMIVKKYHKNAFQIFLDNTNDHSYYNFIGWYARNVKRFVPSERDFLIGIQNN